MNSFLTFFETMPVWMKAGWVFFVLTIFWILEGYYKLVFTKYNKWRHAKTNLILLAFVMLINVVFGIATVGIFLVFSRHYGAFFGAIILIVGALLDMQRPDRHRSGGRLAARWLVD